MAEAHVVEGTAAVEPLVARLQVDRGVAVGTTLIVEVAVVDVDPDAAKPVDDLLEAPEVDRDQVVDREARQLLHGLDRALGAAPGVGVVDLLRGRAAARTGDAHDEVARQREHRDRLRLRVGAQQHQRVGAGRRAVALVGAVVVADDEGDRRLARQRDREAPLRRLHVHRVGADLRDALMEVEVGPTEHAGADHRRGDEEPAEIAARCLPTAALRRLGRAVDGDRCLRGGRQNGLPAPVRGACAADSSFQRCPHGSGEDEGVRSTARPAGE